MRAGPVSGADAAHAESGGSERLTRSVGSASTFGGHSGTSVVKALALGARAVFIGRPVLWGLVHSVSGPASVGARVLHARVVFASH